MSRRSTRLVKQEVVVTPKSELAEEEDTDKDELSGSENDDHIVRQATKKRRTANSTRKLEGGYQDWGLSQASQSQAFDAGSAELIDLAETQSQSSISDDAMKSLTNRVTRYLVFKGGHGAPITLSGMQKDGVFENYRGRKVQIHALSLASKNLRDVFGMDLKQLPPRLMQTSSKNKEGIDRYVVVNTIVDSDHCAAINCRGPRVVDRALVILCCAILYIVPGRKLSENSLWKYLNGVDPTLPGKKPAKTDYHPYFGNLDKTMTRIVDEGYLYRWVDEEMAEHLTMYIIGSRSELEVGRHQILHFLSEVLQIEIPEKLRLEVENDSQQSQAVTN